MGQNRNKRIELSKISLPRLNYTNRGSQRVKNRIAVARYKIPYRNSIIRAVYTITNVYDEKNRLYTFVRIVSRCIRTL